MRMPLSVLVLRDDTQSGNAPRSSSESGTGLILPESVTLWRAAHFAPPKYSNLFCKYLEWVTKLAPTRFAFLLNVFKLNTG
jgi:hypothetical protein